MSSNAGPILARNLAPASVNRTLRVVRANNGSPSRSSTALTAWLTAEGLIFNDAAAAGYGIVGALEETSDSELRAQMETNFFGAINVTKAVLPSMRTQRAGAIVNISSLGGQLSFGGFSAYSASKFALEGMSEALAAELAAFGIKVLIVEPGAFRTGFQALPPMP
jgi:NAD(P)-dependent dehydrogenase (short-subunit alcohol dehydrogenase family)